MNNNETSARRGCGHAGAFCAPRVKSFIEVQQFRVGCVVQLSHRLSSFAQRRAGAVTLCAGHKKARSDPPGRDTYSYDDGPNTQDSVTQVNAFSASSHAPAGAIIAISQIGHSLGLFLFVPLGGCLDPRRLILSLLAAAPGRRRSDIVRMKR